MMHVVYKNGEDQIQIPPKKLTRKQHIERWAVALEAKWRMRDRKEALALRADQLKELGNPIYNPQ